jgi:chromosome segregation ATPase
MATKKTVMTQLTSVGEGALDRLMRNPVTDKAIDGALQVKERVEKLVKGAADLERRVAKVEQRLDELDKRKKPSTKRGASSADESTTTGRG